MRPEELTADREGAQLFRAALSITQLTALLKQAPDIPASAEFLLRRCFYHENNRDGFYVTFYLFGYGSDEVKARQQWGIALKLAGNAITQFSSRRM